VTGAVAPEELPWPTAGANGQDSSSPRLRVALVYPPFGPAALPSLGLALLSAQIKRMGHSCTVHYWNLDMVSAMPFDSPRERLAAYRSLTERTWYPYNEWIFGGEVHGDQMRERDQATALRLINHALALPDEMLSAEAILRLRSLAAALVADMAARVRGADVVGISSTFFQNLPALALAKRIKAVRPGQTVILGGANCDGEMGEALFEHFGFLDAVFAGEADWSITEFLDRFARRHVMAIPGVLWRGPDGTVSKTAAAPPLKDLSGLPYADYTDWVPERRRANVTGAPTVVALEASRGCWWGAKHHCTFCGLNASTMTYRRKAAERMLEEVRVVLSDTEAEFVYMTDNILAMDYVPDMPGWPARTGRRPQYFFEVKSNLRRDQVFRLAEAGVSAVQPGIESLSTEILQLMRKGVTAIQNVAFLKAAQEAGIRAAWNLLVGFPGEDPTWYDSMVSRIPLLTHLRPPATVAQVEFHRFSPYHNDPVAFGLRLRPVDAYAALYPFGNDNLARVAYMFQRDDEDLVRRERTYLPGLSAAVLSWRTSFFTRQARLTESADADGQTVIVDTRPGYGPQTVRLYGFASDLYRLLAEPRGLSALIDEAGRRRDQAPPFSPGDLLRAIRERPHETPIGFSADDFLADAARPSPCCATRACSSRSAARDSRSGWPWPCRPPAAP
jgi:ribosomal peptide maturation radical SAM protein 1